MTKNYPIAGWLMLLALSTLNFQPSTASAQGTAFTYQGQLQNNGSPASGTYNLTFSLFDTNTSGVAVAGPVTNNGVIVSNGLFTVLIDFGPGVFTGETNWLEIAVETNRASTFTTLTPRQQLTPTPYAIYAESASGLSGTLSASQLTSIGNTNGGSGNFFVGLAGNSTMSGSNNTANGFQALYSNASGDYNTADGFQALFNNSDGENNIALGYQAGYNITIGDNNIDIGNQGFASDTNIIRIGTTQTPTYLVGNVYANNVALTNDLPFAVAYTNGVYFINGAFHTAASPLTVIQEAINALPYDPTRRGGGGTLMLSPGWFYTTNTITLPYTTNGYNLNLLGSGMSGSGIIYAGRSLQSVMTVGYPATYNSYVFLMRDLFMASSINQTTNILYLNGTEGAANGAGVGGIGRAVIYSCWFGYWNSMTNNADQPFTPSHDPDAGAHNLIGIYADCQFDDTISITLCSFSYLCSGIRFAVDHGVIQDNCFETCGNYPTGGNMWPHTTPESIGPAVLLENVTWSGIENLGHNDWVISGNNFIGCPVHYVTTMLTNTFSAQVTIYNDTDEYGNTGAMVATTGGKVSFINPRFYLADLPGQWNIHAYLITNTLDYTTYTNTFAPSALVTIADSLYKTNTSAYSYGGTVTSGGGFISSAVGPLTLLTNSTPPEDTSTIRAWVTVTNQADGKVFKMPLYQ